MEAAVQEISDAPVHQRRAFKRFDYEAPCLIHRDRQTLVASVRNISMGGVSLLLEQLGAVPVGKSVTLEIADFTPISAVIRWSEGSTYGLQFLSTAEDHPEISKLLGQLETKNPA